jgi:hypothetical protein
MYDLYDIYLFKAPEDDESVRKTLELKAIKLSSRNNPLSGYLGLNQEFLETTSTLYIFQRAGARGMSVPVQYRDTNRKITKQEATKIAEPFLWEKTQCHHPEYHFDPPFLASEQPMWYIFTIKSEFLPKKGKTHYFAHVDLLDGHIWESEEERYFFKPFEIRMYRLRSGQDKP